MRRGIPPHCTLDCTCERISGRRYETAETDRRPYRSRGWADCSLVLEQSSGTQSEQCRPGCSAIPSDERRQSEHSLVEDQPRAKYRVQVEREKSIQRSAATAATAKGSEGGRFGLRQT